MTTTHSLAASGGSIRLEDRLCALLRARDDIEAAKLALAEARRKARQLLDTDCDPGVLMASLEREVCDLASELLR